MHSLLKAGLLHDDVHTVAGHGLWRYTTEARLDGGRRHVGGGPKQSASTPTCCAAPTTRSPATAGCGCSTATSAARSSRPRPSSPSTGRSRRRRGSSTTRPTSCRRSRTACSTGDFVAVLRFQGPAANGMPELHKLTPALGVLQDRGQRVALVTDGRMSGASGKVPAAIHLTPEAAVGGPLARVQDGDLVTLDADAGVLDLHVAPYDLEPADGRRARRRPGLRHRPRAVLVVPRRGRPGRPGRERLPRPPRLETENADD